jgi:hypothetical protein
LAAPFGRRKFLGSIMIYPLLSLSSNNPAPVVCFCCTF